MKILRLSSIIEIIEVFFQLRKPKIVWLWPMAWQRLLSLLFQVVGGWRLEELEVSRLPQSDFVPVRIGAFFKSCLPFIMYIQIWTICACEIISRTRRIVEVWPSLSFCLGLCNNAKYYGHYIYASSHRQRMHFARTNFYFKETFISVTAHKSRSCQNNTVISLGHAHHSD